MNSTERSTALWLRRFHPAVERPVRLVCFPHAGGSAPFYHPVSARFGADADVIALQYPGRQDRRLEPCVESIATLADLITDELLTLDEKPTVFFGHSMGAVLAFETAWRLEQKGQHAPRSVIASGRRAPSTSRPETVHLRDDDGILTELRLLNGTNPQLLGDEEIVRMAMPAIRGDYRAIESYRGEPGRTVRAPLTVLTGDADPRTSLAEAQAWAGHTEGAFRLRVLPGGHFFLAEQQAAVNEEIARELGLI
ncbi:thioesterase II family protein [Kitasatospora kifunensis]|uniref:Surfactin synthase thioesterase subunit n=1 Tax=Kitasatospora kifunensis TaxID=58351 RepID=A0A7W7R9U8_KITKI|nr:alpha/beta fold hydrolase [Kitasatospora kifunensis]MBB4927431.1 surfactin synthase thioesterase subunit [Kitasatospora kifunensis]